MQSAELIPMILELLSRPLACVAPQDNSLQLVSVFRCL